MWTAGDALRYLAVTCAVGACYGTMVRKIIVRAHIEEKAWSGHVDRRPVSEWAHMPAVEHAVGFPCGLSAAGFLANSIPRTDPRVRLVWAATPVAYTALYLFFSRKVVDRRLYDAQSHTLITSYIPMREYLRGKRGADDAVVAYRRDVRY